MKDCLSPADAASGSTDIDVAADNGPAPIEIAESQDHFVRDGKPFFYLADTVWSTFTNPILDEWIEYLEYRKQQGFNVLQINILPQWDRSVAPSVAGRSVSQGKARPEKARPSPSGRAAPAPDKPSPEPFKQKADGTYDFSAINREYFDRACRFLDEAVVRGFTPALVVLWCDYVENTWASRMVPGHVMPLDRVGPYTEFVVETFKRYRPIYIVSGDTGFTSSEQNAYYKKAMEVIKQKEPTALTTLHLNGANHAVPEEFIQDGNLDFYMYQSGHNIGQQDMPYKPAEGFLGKSVTRPILNGEPCYEAHGHGHGHSYGRYHAFWVRKAVWQSLLSGAKAGVTYGAHGIWSFHRKGDSFPNKDFSGIPLDWRTALRLPGAWDTAFARTIFEQYGLFDIEPAQYLLGNDNPEIRIAASVTSSVPKTVPEPCSAASVPQKTGAQETETSVPGPSAKTAGQPSSDDFSTVALYMPYTAEIKLTTDLTGLDWTLFDLAERRTGTVDITASADGSTITMPEYNADLLLIGCR